MSKKPFAFQAIDGMTEKKTDCLNFCMTFTVRVTKHQTLVIKWPYI